MRPNKRCWKLTSSGQSDKNQENTLLRLSVSRPRLHMGTSETGVNAELT